jgi:alpha-L-fucosidase
VDVDKVYRIAPGETIVLQVGVKNKVVVAEGITRTANFKLKWGTGDGDTISSSEELRGMCGFGDYTASMTSSAYHSSPDLYNDPKFGIFIHWGVYSAPVYGNFGSNEYYAERRVSYSVSFLRSLLTKLMYWHSMNNSQ